MIIDTQRLRGALRAQVEKESDEIDKRYPYHHGDNSRSIKAFRRLEEMERAAEELIVAVETLAETYIIKE